MKAKFFTIHALHPSEGEDRLNAFCHQVKVINMEKHFVPSAEASFWSICVNYIENQQASAETKRTRVELMVLGILEYTPCPLLVLNQVKAKGLELLVSQAERCSSTRLLYQVDV